MQYLFQFHNLQMRLALVQRCPGEIIRSMELRKTGLMLLVVNKALFGLSMITVSTNSLTVLCHESSLTFCKRSSRRNCVMNVTVTMWAPFGPCNYTSHA